MIVLLDLEWINDTQKHLTQLSAIRVDFKWKVTARYDALICPGPEGISDPGHMAYGGYAADQFVTGIDESTCMQQFADWLEDGEQIWTWANSNRIFFEMLWRSNFSTPAPTIQYKSEKAKVIAASKGITAYSPYQILFNAGIAAPEPVHRSSNDVEAMRLLFKYLDITNWEDELVNALSPSQLREWNADTVNRSQYNYLYVPGSDVFHRRDCKLVLGAKIILGSRHFVSAAMSRRPCKVCRPVAGLELAPAIEAPVHHSNYIPLPPADDRIVPVKRVDGKHIHISKNKLLGWCNYKLHYGAVTKPILDQHNCVGKGCCYFQKNASSTYWAEQKIKTQEKANARLLRKEQKRNAVTLEQRLRTMQEEWQSILDDMDSDMQVVRLESASPTQYTIYYVSDNAFADGNRFPNFLGLLRKRYPKTRFILRHIKDLNGRFVTREEYHVRVIWIAEILQMFSGTARHRLVKAS